MEKFSLDCSQLYSDYSEISSQRFFWNYEIVLICWLVLICIPNGWFSRAILSIHLFSQNLLWYQKNLIIEIVSILTNNGSSKSDINIVNVSPISNFYNWSACPHSLVNWFVSIPYCDITALNAVPSVTIWSSNTVVIDRTPNKIIDTCVHINLKNLSTWHFPFTVIQTVNFWITSDCERITFIANLKNKNIDNLSRKRVGEMLNHTHMEGVFVIAERANLQNCSYFRNLKGMKSFLNEHF